MLRGLIKEGIDDALFGLFCIIDGVRAVEDAPDKGRYELHYVKNGQSTSLNPGNSPLLHDLYNQS
jgi:hypothetical protein